MADGGQIKAGLVDTVLPAVWDGQGVQLLGYGNRPPVLADDVVLVGNVRTTVDYPTMGRTPSRGQQETHDVDVIISSSVRGPQEAQRARTDRCFELYRLLNDYLMAAASTNQTLGVSSRTEARVIGYELTEHDDPDVVEVGRSSSLKVTLQVWSRR